MELTLSRIAKAVGGRLSGYDCIVTSVSTDSRDIPKGCLFICLEGEKFDGHDFCVAGGSKRSCGGACP